MNDVNVKQIIHHEKQKPLVWLILILSCIPFAILQSNGITAIADWFMPEQFSSAMTPTTFWKLWSPTFVHYTPAHLLTNALLWWLFAGKIERDSKTELIVIFIAIAALANISQWLITGVKFGGLSGVVYGLMGYMSILYYKGDRKNFHIDPILVFLMLALIPFSFSDIFGKLSSYAHIGGLACGCLLAVANLAINTTKKSP